MEVTISIVSILGMAAGALTVVSFMPQVFRAWKTRQVKDLSLWTFALLLTAGGLWITYGVMRTDWPVIVTNVGMVTLNLAILAAKLRFG